MELLFKINKANIEFLKNLPVDPGVYLMRGSDGQLLYVGKAKNLKNRVSTYFQEGAKHAPRIELLVRKIENVELILTDNEVEALLLECNLIKKHRPKFNVSLRDDKTYPYVRLDQKHPFPRLEYTRKVRRDGARYFGPYVSAFEIKDLLRWAQKTFQLRDCSDAEFRNRARPCILHQMGQCTAPCVDLISEEDYAARIEHALKTLDGEFEAVLKLLRREMDQAAENEEFELAGALRDRIRNIEIINQEQKITDPESTANQDIIELARGAGIHAPKAVAVVMSVRDGRTVGVFQYPFEDLDPDLDDGDVLFEFLAQYYVERAEEAPKLLPETVLLPSAATENKDQLKLLTKAIGGRTDFAIPKRKNDLLAMVKKTAEFHLENLCRKVTHLVEDLLDVQRRLDLRKFPHRIECFDISHFQGEGTVASRVVFIEGRPDKTLYRHYHVRDVEGPDDFKSLREIIERRFTGDPSYPDLLLVDGGRGQLAQAELVFRELRVPEEVELASIAKARTESSFEDAEVKGSMERIFKPNQKNPILLKPGTGAHRILTQARDESHRFAITFHRKTRAKRRFR